VVGCYVVECGEKVIGFRDELHVDVFDVVVDHLHVMVRVVGVYVCGAGFFVGYGFFGCLVF